MVCCTLMTYCGGPHSLFVQYQYDVSKVLKFKGWYKESVPENPSEQYRIRYVDILYFLEDDSMTIIEPKVENSGLSQGN